MSVIEEPRRAERPQQISLGSGIRHHGEPVRRVKKCAPDRDGRGDWQPGERNTLGADERQEHVWRPGQGRGIVDLSDDFKYVPGEFES